MIIKGNFYITLIRISVITSVVFAKEGKNLLNVDSQPKQEQELEYDAVKKLHIHLDEDKDGDVDYSESQEFLQHELNVKDSKRHSKFHSGDGSISVTDLWKAWQKSEVSKWSPDEVADWLTNVVHLPQYAETFRKNKINGHHLPRLGSPDDKLLNELKISNIIARKKIALRAMDAVLFGDLRRHNYLKDCILALVVLLAIMGFGFSNVQKRKAQKQMELMMKDVEILQDAEKNLTSLQNRLQEAESNHQVVQQEKFQLENNLKEEIEVAKQEAQRLREAREGHSEEIHTRLKLAEQELVQVREALRKAEKEVEYLSYEMSTSLQKWLQLTYQKEVKNFQYRRDTAMRKMEEAKDACYRLKRKRSTLLGSLRLAHDHNMDDVDQRIIAARSSLAEVTNDLEELQYRWQQIETCCRLDLGVCTSFLMSDSTDSFVKYPQPVRITSTTSRESPPIHRVATQPSFPSFDETSDSPRKSGKQFKRNISDPCGSESHEYESIKNGAVSTFTKRSIEALDNYDASRDMEIACAMSQNEGSLISDDSMASNTFMKSNSINNSLIDNYKSSDQNLNSSKSSLEDKNSTHKKKWWSRVKKHNTDEGSNHFVSLPQSKGSMPLLTQ